MSTLTAFAVASLERAVKTFAQTLVALLVADGTDLIGTAWGDRLSVAGMAAVISVLTSVASAPFGGTGPSLVNEVTEPPAHDPVKDGGYGVIDLLVIVILVVLLVWLIVTLVGR